MVSAFRKKTTLCNGEYLWPSHIFHDELTVSLNKREVVFLLFCFPTFSVFVKYSGYLESKKVHLVKIKKKASHMFNLECENEIGAEGIDTMSRPWWQLNFRADDIFITTYPLKRTNWWDIVGILLVFGRKLVNITLSWPDRSYHLKVKREVQNSINSEHLWMYFIWWFY